MATAAACWRARRPEGTTSSDAEPRIDTAKQCEAHTMTQRNSRIDIEATIPAQLAPAARLSAVNTNSAAAGLGHVALAKQRLLAAVSSTEHLPPVLNSRRSSSKPSGKPVLAASRPAITAGTQQELSQDAAPPTLLDLAAPEDLSLLASGGGAAQAPLPQGAASQLPEHPGEVRQASMAELGDLIGSVVGKVASELRSDIVRLEATWQARWHEQAASTADLRGRLESLQPSSPAQAREVQSQLPDMAAAPDLPAAAAVFANPVWDPTPPAAATGAHTGDAPSVTAILRRLSLLEERVGQQLDHIEGMCATGRSCDSPPALEDPDAFGPAPPATLAYGSGSPAARQGSHGKGSQSWVSPLETASPRSKPSQVPRPSGTAAGRNLQASREVDQQVAATHAVITQIQGQIAAIKISLAQATAGLTARRAEAGAVALRLDRLELKERFTTTAEAAGAAGRATLERRVCSLEGRMAAGSSQAAREALAEVAALTWRVDRTSEATIGAIKSLESRQDKLRSELRSSAAVATLADAKAATLAAEVARVQRRLHALSERRWQH